MSRPSRCLSRVFGSLLIGVVLAACGDADDEPDLQSARDFKAFDLYYVGDSFNGLPLTDVIRGSGRGPNRGWSFIYGSCEAQGDEGCAPPLEIQNASICTRYPALFGKREPTLTPFRGAERARGSAELYTGRTAVVIYGGEKQAALRALRPVQETGAAGGFPPPTDGALEGRLPCQRAGLAGS